MYYYIMLKQEDIYLSLTYRSIIIFMTITNDSEEVTTSLKESRKCVMTKTSKKNDIHLLRFGSYNQDS